MDEAMNEPEDNRAPEERKAQRLRQNRIFFSCIFGANIILFVAIAALEYRAYVIAGLTRHEAGLKIEIILPERPREKDMDIWRRAQIEARRLFVSGRAEFRKCALCHGVEDKARNFGPNLECVGGRPIADVDELPNEDYRYSAALLRVADQKGRWTLQNMLQFIADPAAFERAAGELKTRMPFPGLVRCGDGSDACRAPLTSGHGNARALRDIALFLYWSCKARPQLRELRLVTVKEDNSCEQERLREDTPLTGFSPSQLLLPAALPECD